MGESIIVLRAQLFKFEEVCKMFTEEFLKKTVCYQVPGMDQTNVRKNLCYQTVNDQEYKFDIYLPNNRSISKFPVVVLVHGEAPIKNVKDIGYYSSMGSIIAASGMAAVAFDHRMVMHGASISEVCADIRQVITFIGSNAKELNIDRDSIAVWSLSAGVPFGLKACYELSDNLRGIVAYYGPPDFESLWEFFNVKSDAHKEHKPLIEIIAESPNKTTPLFIARAGLDSPAINKSIDKFADIALNRNLDVTICNHATGQHAFDMLDDTARTREIIGMTLTFLTNNLIADS